MGHYNVLFTFIYKIEIRNNHVKSSISLANDTNGSPITEIGSSLVTGRIGAIELKAVTHHLSIPVDGNTGRLTGTRVHTPITVQKDFDKTTPFIQSAE